MLLVESLTVLATLLSPIASRVDTALRAKQADVCEVGDQPSAAVIADLRAALEAHGGAVRWDLARGPIRVWLQRRPDYARDVAVTSADWRRAVAAAADAWRDVVPRLAFASAPDSAQADVVVTWERDLASAPAVGELSFRTAGRTTLVPSDDGHAVLAHMRLAVFAPGGARYSLEDVRAVARHEFGHALGLADHGAPSSVMAPLVRTEQLSDDDRATLRALYALPIGARCTAPSRDTKD
jgi:hypothetical protein